MFSLLLFTSCNNQFDIVQDVTDSPVLVEDNDILSLSSSCNKQPLFDTLSNGLILERRDSLLYWDDMCFTERSVGMLCEDDRSACLNGVQYYWPYGIVYYKFDISVPPWERSTFASALNTIMNNTSIVFRYRYDDSVSNYIIFKKATKNNSFIGMQTGSQVINIVTVSTQTIIHEVMHSLGFFHEHCRSDRDNSIIIDSLNIKPLKWHNFQKYTAYYSGMDLGDFDFNSIMLYDSKITDTSFVFDTSILTMYKKSDGSPFYQGSTLSSDDINGIKSIYGPPFHRLEHHRLNIIDNSVNGYWEYYITENADSLIFYSDKECTSRQPLLYPRRVKIKQTVCTNNGYDLEYNTYYTTLTIPAGTVAYEIWHGYNYECYCNSDPYNINLTDNEVLIPHVPDVSFQ